MNSDRGDGVRRVRAERLTKLREAEPAAFLLVQDPDRRERPQQTVERVRIRPGCTRQLLTRTRTDTSRSAIPSSAATQTACETCCPTISLRSSSAADTGRAYSLGPLVLACAGVHE